MSDDRWFSETLTPGLRLSFEASSVVLEKQTSRQDLALFDHPIFGRVLMLDGVVQVTTRDEFIYHEMMAHVPILGHGAARDVLIIGGGDCGLAEEVLKHESVRSLTQVEIDPTIIELARDHFAEMNASVFADSRFRLVIEDGAAFTARPGPGFDVVLVDSTDPIGPGRVLFTEPFYRSIRARLNPRGVLVTQNGVPFVQSSEFSAAVGNLASVFEHVSCYAVAVPTYFGGHLALGLSAEDEAARLVPLDVLRRRFEQARLDTSYYTPEIHLAAFALPRYLEETFHRAVAPARRGGANST